jgi:hypothetical protein
MPCVIGCLALFTPRLAIILVFLFSDYLGEAYRTNVWPVLGFFFMPLTTLAYAWAWHIPPQGSVSGLGLVVVIVAALIDLGIIGGNAAHPRARSYYWKRRQPN